MSSPMADDALPACVNELNVLRSMAVCLRAGERLDFHEVERGLEAGFGALIGLEAELARVPRASAPETPAVQAAARADLKHRISELR
jgi:hypothetical protein